VRKLLTFFVLLCSFFMVITCGSQDGAEPTATTTTAEGIVTSQTGAPMVGVSIRSTVDGTVSDASGRFSVELPSGTSAVLQFEETGFASVVRRVDAPAGVDFVTVSATMTAPTLVTTVDVSTGPATVTFSGGTLGLPQGSIQLSDGSSPAGPIDVAVTYLPPEVATLSPPVPLIGVDGGEQGRLVTFGMIDVTLSYLGQEANLRPGTLASIQLVAEPGDPPSAPLWDADMDAGLWNRIGTALNVGNMWTAEVTHFSWKNVDMFFKVPEAQWACLRFRVLDPEGEPVRGAEIQTLWGPNNRFTAAGTTDAAGELCHEQFPGGDIVLVNYRAFLRGDAERWVEGSLTVTPLAYGETCQSPACQLVPITIACASDSECGQGETCNVSGICIDDNDPPVTTGWMGNWMLEQMNGEDPAVYYLEETIQLTQYTAIDTLTDTSTGMSCTNEADLTVTGDTMYFDIVSTTCANASDSSAQWLLNGAQDELTLTVHETAGVFVYGRIP
jgi:Carboxypeptidase regulatory-like domain